MNNIKVLRGVCIALICVVVVLAHALVRVENQRYALFTGLCDAPVRALNIEQIRTRFDCLENVQSRTSWVWHLYFALNE